MPTPYSLSLFEFIHFDVKVIPRKVVKYEVQAEYHHSGRGTDKNCPEIRSKVINSIAQIHGIGTEPDSGNSEHDRHGT